MASVHRVFVEGLGSGDETLEPQELRLQDAEAHHLTHVLRARSGDRVVLFDGRGFEADAVLCAVDRRAGVTVRAVSAARRGVGPDRAGVILLQGLAKPERLELVVRQATELGVAAVWPVVTARSVPRTGASEDRIARWRAIARSAAAQCRRADVPTVEAPRPLEVCLAALPAACVCRLVPWEDGRRSLPDVLAGAPSPLEGGGCAVLVGPEGGLEAGEVALAEERGFLACSLGPRVLRTETVAPAILAMLSVLRGDLRAGTLPTTENHPLCDPTR